MVERLTATARVLAQVDFCRVDAAIDAYADLGRKQCECLRRIVERAESVVPPEAIRELRADLARFEGSHRIRLESLSDRSTGLPELNATAEKALRMAHFHVRRPGAESGCAGFVKHIETLVDQLTAVTKAADRVAAQPSDMGARGLASTLQLAFAAALRLDEYWDKNLAQRVVEQSRDFAFSDPSGKALDRLLGSLDITPTPPARVAFHHVLTRKPRGRTWARRVSGGAADFTERWFPGQVVGESGRVASADHRSADVQKRDVPLDGDRSFAAADARWDREPQPTPEEELEAIENIERLHALIREARLSRRQREVALAIGREDTTLADVARDLGIAPADARKHWERARPKLREAALRLRIGS